MCIAAEKSVYSSSVHSSDKPAITSTATCRQPCLSPLSRRTLACRQRRPASVRRQSTPPASRRQDPFCGASSIVSSRQSGSKAAAVGLTMPSAHNSPRIDSTGTQQTVSSDSKALETQVPPISASREKPLDADEETKVQRIVNATEARDWQALRNLAASPGGFIDDEVRRVVCMCKGKVFLFTTYRSADITCRASRARRAARTEHLRSRLDRSAKTSRGRSSRVGCQPVVHLLPDRCA